MELFRPSARATQISFPIKDLEGRIRTGATALDSEWIAWGDTSSPTAQGNPGFADMVGEASEIATTGTYTLAVAAAELPAASPYVMIRVQSTNAATQYILIRTASLYANVTGINGTNITAPVTAGYMPVDVKQTIALTSMADNSIEKALARTFMATQYIDAAVSSRSAPATAQTIDQTVAISAGTDNSIGKCLGRLYQATTYLDAAVSSRSTLAGSQTIDQTTVISAGTDNSIGKCLGRLYQATTYLDAAVSQGVLATTLSLTSPTDNTLGKALSRLYMMATNYVDAAISSRSTLAGAQTIDQTVAISAGTDNSIGKCLGRLYQATQYLDAAVSTRLAPSTVVTLGSPTDNTVDKALARMYMVATNYIDAAVSSRSAPASAQTIDQTTAISGGTDNSIGKCLARLYQATPFTALTIGTVNTLATGAISSGSFSANAIDAASVDVTTGSEFADAFLGRSVRGGASTGRRVYEAIAFLRNRVNLAADTLTVYQTDDLTTEWTATTATEAVTAILTDINPA